LKYIEGGETMANLQVGLQLMIVGMSIVFLVLILLKYIMKTMSAIIRNINSKANSNQPLKTEAQVEDLTADEELAVIMAVVTGMLTDVKDHIVQIHVVKPNTQQEG
jgi:sodium pump decarboxylase gamma subunit